MNLIKQGKVRDIYYLDDEHSLVYTSDRVSAFDVVLPTEIPGKGELLCQMSAFWKQTFRSLVKNDMVSLGEAMSYWDCIPNELRTKAKQIDIVKWVKPLPIEAIVRGYIIGSGWKEYQEKGSIGGLSIPPHYQLADKFYHPIFTPSTKADVGLHDENISFDEMCDILGDEQLAYKVRRISIQLYNNAQQYASGRGIIIADTKFEFGLDNDGELVLIDEVLTSDSSRYWDTHKYVPGKNPESYDKQILRDYLKSVDFDELNPPVLPDSIVKKISARYNELLNKIVR